MTAGRILQHGIPSSYNKGCRCDECREAQRQRARKRRKQLQEKKAKGLLREAKFEHGKSGYANWDCRCAVCTAAHNEACKPSTSRWRAKNKQAVNDRNRRDFARWQAETRERASRHGFQWTGPELELAAREDLTSREVARMIGRTLASVAHMRRKLKDDPKTITLAGVPRRAT